MSKNFVIFSLISALTRLPLTTVLLTLLIYPLTTRGLLTRKGTGEKLRNNSVSEYKQAYNGRLARG